MSTRAFGCEMYLVYTFSTQIKDEDQTQEEDEV
jgi:hypothetical protein